MTDQSTGDSPTDFPADFPSAFQRAREQISQRWASGESSVPAKVASALNEEGAVVTAAILSASELDPGVAEQWALATGRRASDINSWSIRAERWQSNPTDQLRELIAAGSPLASDYAFAIGEFAAAAASTRPIDLLRINSAAFIASAQLRAAGVVVSDPASASAGESVPTSSAGIGAHAAVPAANDRNVPEAHPAAASEGVAIAQQTPVGAPESAEEPVEPLADLLAELDALVGLADVKQEIKHQAETLRIAKIRAERGLRNPDISRHLIFTGNPGTGKTTVARLVARIYRSLGLLEKGHLIEVDRTGLVAGYLGQTEQKTAEVIEKSLGGVLFIDEAYGLSGDQYGDAAITTLVKAIEDHRDDLVLIVAGYTGPMEEFVDANPGLASRLRLTICFPDYADDELIEIFTRLAEKSDYTPTPGCVEALRRVLEHAVRDESFGNARFVRNCFEAALVRQAWRLRDVENPSDEQLRALTEDDVATPMVLPEAPPAPE